MWVHPSDPQCIHVQLEMSSSFSRIQTSDWKIDYSVLNSSVICTPSTELVHARNYRTNFSGRFRAQALSFCQIPTKELKRLGTNMRPHVHGKCFHKLRMAFFLCQKTKGIESIYFSHRYLESCCHWGVQGPLNNTISPPPSSEVVVAEWLRRWTRNPLGSPRVGSNPADYDRSHFVTFRRYTFIITAIYVKSRYTRSCNVWEVK